MAVPETSGKLCTSLREMDIGDYIIWYYIPGASGTAGDFSKTMATGAQAFYFIKVDKGLLIANRHVFYTSYTALNEKNYITGRIGAEGEMYRTLSPGEYKKYVAESNLNSTILTSNILLFDTYQRDYLNNYTVFGKRDDLVIEVPSGYGGCKIYSEITDKTSVSSVCTLYSPEGRLISNGIFKFISTSHYYEPPKDPYDRNDKGQDIYHTFTLFASQYKNMDQNYVSTTGRWEIIVNGKGIGKYMGAEIKDYVYYRPALEYIDNPKSKTIWY